MRKAIATGSKYALEAQQMGLDSYSFSDDKYVYYFDILNKNNNAFGITYVKEINTVSEEVYNERKSKENTDGNNRLSRVSTIYEKGYNNSNINSIENRTTSDNFSKLPKGEQRQQGSNENRQIIEKSIGDSKELDNSSFSMEENSTTNEDIRYSNNSNFDEYIENRVGKEGTRTRLGELKLPTAKNNIAERAKKIE